MYLLDNGNISGLSSASSASANSKTTSSSCISQVPSNSAKVSSTIGASVSSTNIQERFASDSQNISACLEKVLESEDLKTTFNKLSQGEPLTDPEIILAAKAFAKAFLPAGVPKKIQGEHLNAMEKLQETIQQLASSSDQASSDKQRILERAYRVLTQQTLKVLEDKAALPSTYEEASRLLQQTSGGILKRSEQFIQLLGNKLEHFGELANPQCSLGLKDSIPIFQELRKLSQVSSANKNPEDIKASIVQLEKLLKSINTLTNSMQPFANKDHDYNLVKEDIQKMVTGMQGRLTSLKAYIEKNDNKPTDLNLEIEAWQNLAAEMASVFDRLADGIDADNPKIKADLNKELPEIRLAKVLLIAALVITAVAFVSALSTLVAAILLATGPLGPAVSFFVLLGISMMPGLVILSSLGLAFLPSTKDLSYQKRAIDTGAVRDLQTGLRDIATSLRKADQNA